MPGPSPPQESAPEWLSRARGDLALARVALPDGGYYEDLCFHAQQAAEKALKAVHIHRSTPFRYVPDLDELITGLRTSGVGIPGEVVEAVVLSSYAAAARYPGLYEPVGAEEYSEAVRLAERVVEFAERDLSSGATSDAQ